MTEEQLALRDAVRALLNRRSNPRKAAESPLGHDPALWATLCAEIGVAALAIPEDRGGVGASIAETCVVAGELGRTLTPAPLLGSAVLAACALLELGDEELLPEIANGRIAALAHTADCTAEHDRLTGEAHYVLDGDIADILLVPARINGELGLYQVADAEREFTPTMDNTRRLATIRLNGTPGRKIGGNAETAMNKAIDTACVVLAAEQVGAMRKCLDMTVEYAKTRVQFGRPIGGFQALKHRMADLHVLVETARSAALAAVDDLAKAPVAKIYCAEAFQQVTAEMIQLHGGIAITWEHDAQLFFKRAHGSAQLFGDPARYVSRLAATALEC